MGPVLDWDSFEKKLRELRAEHQSRTYPLLFRGQANSAWKLTTTLERSAKTDLPLLRVLSADMWKDGAGGKDLCRS